MAQDAPIPLETLAGIYIKMRSKIAELTKEYDTAVEGIKAQQDAVASELKDRITALGPNTRSVNTAGGTVLLVEKTRYFPSDWSSFKTFIVEHNALDLLEKRVAQGNMAKFLEENPEKYPPGLQSETELSITVRKPSAKA